MAVAGTYNLALKLLGIPEFQGETKKASRGWQDIGNQTKQFGRQTNLTRDALKDFSEETEKFADKLRKIFPEFSGIAGLLGGGGLIAGLAGLGRSFANTGTEILNTSRRIGISEKLLQGWRKAADLAGDSADDATSSFRGLAQNVFAAERGEQAGINAQIVAQKYGVHFGRGQEEQTLRDLNRVFNTNPLLKNNPQKAQGVEEAITGNTGLYDLLSKAPADFNRIMKEAAATPSLTKQQAEDAARAHEAFSQMTQAVTQLGINLGQFTDKWLVPLETAMSKVINAANRSPVASDQVGIAATAAAGGLAVKLLGGLGKFLGVLPKGLAIPAGPIAGLIGAAMEAVEIHRKYPTAEANKPFQDWLKSEGSKDRSGEAPRLLRDSLDALKRSIDDLRDWWSGAGGGGGIAGMGRPRHGDIFGPARPARPLNPADEKQAMDFFTSKGLTKSQAAGVVGTLEQESRLDPKARNASGHVGIAQWDQNRQAGLGGSTSLTDQLNYIWQEWRGNEAASFARIKAAGTPEGTAEAMEGYERGGNYSGRHQIRARQIYEAMPGAPGLASGGAPMQLPDVNVTAPGALGSRVPAYLRNLPGSEDQNPPRMPTAAEPLPGAGDRSTGGPQGSLDSKHHFVLDIRNAPPGTRGQMASAEGRATAEVRTSYALEGV